MITWFARIEPCDDATHRDVGARLGLLVKQDGDGLLVGVERQNLTVSMLRSTMRSIALSRVSHDAMLIWAFSSVAIPVVDLARLLQRWDETGEPPVLSIIALDSQKNSHVTRGLAALVGHEFAVRFDRRSHVRNAARNLIRLARYAMMNGGLARDVIYEGVDGEVLRLEWADSATSPVMVTIVLQSIRNGYGSD
jgi:hypothetical protein